MATIALSKAKLNGLGGFIDTLVTSTSGLDSQLSTLKSTLQGVDSNTYNLQSAVDSISASSKTENGKKEDLKKLKKGVDDFITTAVNKDNAVRDEINKAKEDFYTKYSYLKPECEKSGWEKFKDTVVSTVEWCKEHWKFIVTVIIVVVAVVLLCTGVGSGLGATLIAGACWGAISGAVIGGISGGLQSMANGGSFFDGFEDGAFSGAISGAIMGAAFAGIGAAGTAVANSAKFAKFAKCTTVFGKMIKGTAAVSKTLSIGMMGFDMLALADLAFDNKNNPIANLNSKLHSNKAYNLFQLGVSALAVFTSPMAKGMKCFIAGTLVATAIGLRKIESIKAGDLVISTDPETGETGVKSVLETYIRKESNLVHIFVGDDEIVSTLDHPFYVVGEGFVNAGRLTIGTPLQLSSGEVVPVDNIYRETLEEDDAVNVYNFQVEDWHTYFVGENCLLVHNANYGSEGVKSSGIPVKDRVTAENGLDYQSNPKHTLGQIGNRPNAGIEPQNSLDLFNKSVESSKQPGVRFTYDESTGTLHRFADSNDGSWHWNGSTNQGNNSLKSSQVPIDIIRKFNLPKKGW